MAIGHLMYTDDVR